MDPHVHPFSLIGCQGRVIFPFFLPAPSSKQLATMHALASALLKSVSPPAAISMPHVT